MYPGKHPHARTLASGVGHDFEGLEHQREIDDARDDDEEQRQDQRELHQFGATRVAEAAAADRPRARAASAKP